MVLIDKIAKGAFTQKHTRFAVRLVYKLLLLLLLATMAYNQVQSF